MNMKNAAILLIFLLCILGLIIGVYYTETDESSAGQNKNKEVIHEDSSGTITISLEPTAKNESGPSKYFT